MLGQCWRCSSLVTGLHLGLVFGSGVANEMVLGLWFSEGCVDELVVERVV